jgi:hypothetical protein
LKNINNNRISTLYAAKPNPELSKVKLATKSSGATSIKLWKSDTLFYGLAEDI